MATFDLGRVPIDELSAIKERYSSMNIFQRLSSSFNLIFWSLKFIFQPNAVRQTPDRATQIKTLMALKFISSVNGALLFNFIVLSPYIIGLTVTVLLIPEFAQGCYGCAVNNPYTIYGAIVLGGVLLSFAIIFAIKARKLPDIWKIFEEGRGSAKGVIVSFTGFLVLAFGQFDEIYYMLVMFMGGFYFAFFYVTSWQILSAMKSEGKSYKSLTVIRSRQSNLQNNSESSGSRILSKTDGETGNSVLPVLSSLNKNAYPKLMEICSSSTLFRLFEHHVSQEFGSENISFIQDVNDWRSSFPDIAKTARLARAKKIINSYVVEGALNQVNLSYEMISELEKIKDEQEVKHETFDRSTLEIANLLEVGAVQRFLKSDAYKQYWSGDVVVRATEL